MKILLIHPITRTKNITEDRVGIGYPTGIGYIGAYLQEQGHEVTIFDNNQKCYGKDKLTKYLEDSDADIVGISAMVNAYNQVMQLTRLIKEVKGCPIVLGGAMATYSPEVIMRNMDVDVCVLGEGEETAGELFGNWPNYAGIPGIAYMEDDEQFVKTEDRMFAKTRDDYPYPGYDGLLDISKYWRATLATWETHIRDEKLMHSYKKRVHEGMKIATMVTGMGCPYKCTFCTNSTHYMKTRERTPQNVAKEAMYLKNKFGIEGIRFDDDLLILQKKRTLELCKELKKTGLLWSGQSVGRATSEDAIVAEMADAGCVGFGVGIETGSDRLLKAMLKGSRTKHYEMAYHNAIKHGVGIRVQLLYGSPGEDRSTLEETVDFFKRTGMPPRRFNRLLPMPGSAVFDQCLEQGIIYNEHDFLNCTSMISGYTSRSINFNITSMSDEEYLANQDWAETALYKNYEDKVKSDPSFWYYLIKHYVIKILKVKPLVRFITRKITSTLLNKRRDKRTDYQHREAEQQKTLLTTLYPEMLPDPDKIGFKNKPLVDKRIDVIFSSAAEAAEAEAA